MINTQDIKNWISFIDSFLKKLANVIKKYEEVNSESNKEISNVKRLVTDIERWIIENKKYMDKMLYIIPSYSDLRDDPRDDHSELQSLQKVLNSSFDYLEGYGKNCQGKIAKLNTLYKLNIIFIIFIAAIVLMFTHRSKLTKRKIK